MAKESSSSKGAVENPLQLLRRLEEHDYHHVTESDTQRWADGKEDWTQIKQGVNLLPNGQAILDHYIAARMLATYGHE